MRRVYLSHTVQRPGIQRPQKLVLTSHHHHSQKNNTLISSSRPLCKSVLMCNLRRHVAFSFVALNGVVPSISALLTPIANPRPFRQTASTSLNLPVPSSGRRRGRVSPRGRSSSGGLLSTTSLLMANLWERLQIDEDDEPMWYLLNCVAGLEIDLLRQCRQRCDGMEDVVKFVVPTVRTTRSHGANRMVTETKVRYQGYVFAKLRLCARTYQAVQGLDLCRSWMGTVNHKGNRKLPPAPVALNEDEIEKFGLEGLEYEEPDDEEAEGVIVDTAEKDAEDARIEEEALKVYCGLRVEDMVKVTAKGKLCNEDGIVRRLKDGRIMVRFYTYGSTYDEWIDPGDVRKLSNVEILKGLSGPSQPITQREFDGPQRRGPHDYDGRRQGDLRRNLMDNVKGSTGGMQRNRRQDRAAGRFRDQRNADEMRNERNWNWYKENQRRNQGGGYSDGNQDIRGSGDRGGSWAQGDVNSQWGRGRPGRRTQQNSQRHQTGRQPGRPENARGNQKHRRGQNDWSTFVSSASSSSNGSAKGGKDASEDFFAELMSDLSKDLNSGSSSVTGQDTPDGYSTSEEDDFFKSLMSEISEDSVESEPSLDQSGSPQAADVGNVVGTFQKEYLSWETPQKGASAASQDDDDFFTSLEAELGTSLVGPESLDAAEDADNFFSLLASDLETSQSVHTKKARSTNDEVESSPATSDFLFSSLEEDLGNNFFGGQVEVSNDDGANDDFFANLAQDIESDLGATDKGNEVSVIDRTVSAVDAEENLQSHIPSPGVTQETAPSQSSLDPATLTKLTVPKLKEMLRDRGMRVSGTKAVLIERLMSE